MEFKDEMARQELGKVKEAQIKRRCIKSIKYQNFQSQKISLTIATHNQT